MNHNKYAENKIAAVKKQMEPYESNEYLELYQSINHKYLPIVFSTLHAQLVELFNVMNERLPTIEPAHFWADPSRQLIHTIEQIFSLSRSLKNSKWSFSIEAYYYEIINKCHRFLSKSGGSNIPGNMQKIDLFYEIPIFNLNEHVVIAGPERSNYEIKKIGEGSYAKVFQFKDNFYNKKFALKRANPSLTSKELERFEQEFKSMNSLNSPYVVEVYSYDEKKKEYVMEHLDCTLEDYYKKNNSTLTIQERINIGNQFLRGIKHIHNKKMLHRDLSPRNILLKIYDDLIIVKISDFGLVKQIDSMMTSYNTELKGSFNDPSLVTEGFKNYNFLHEVYAITRILYYILTGRTAIDFKNNNELKTFFRKGTHPEKSKRYSSLDEIVSAFNNLAKKY